MHNTPRAYIFPGQGSQIIGMGHDFYREFALSRAVFQEIDDTLGAHLSKIIFEGPDDKLTLTENTQAALMAVSMAIFAVIEQNRGNNIQKLCSYVAGHSLGEYSALCAAKSLSLKDTAMLLRTRGSSMQSACSIGIGAMAACLNIKIAELEQLIEKTKGKYICQIANDNIEGQIVISGHNEAINAMINELQNIGKKAIKLKVSAPFHSELMKPAEHVMQKALEQVVINKPLVPIIANVTAAEVTDPMSIRQNLISQICGRVRWRESLERFKQLGIEEIVEIGSGKILSNMIKKAGYPFTTRNVSNIAELEEFMKIA